MSRVATPSDIPQLSHRQILEILSGLLMGMFVAILSSTVVSNALPTIMNDLDGGQSAYTWVVVAALLATTASTPIWSKLADLFSKKILVQTALVMFIVSSAIAGLSQNTSMLITMRVFQGISGGGLIALVQVVIAYLVPPRERGRYSGYIGATFAVATVGGPLIGGVIVQQLSWHYCFFVGVPFALIAFVMLQKNLNLPIVKREVHIDYWGSFLIVAAVSDILIWVSLAGKNFEWVSAASAAMIIGGAVLLAAAIFAESKAIEPIIPLRLFKIRTVSLAALSSLFVGVAMFGATIYLGQYFQLARGDSPTKAGLMSIPMILGLAIASTVSGNIITRTGSWKKFLVAGAFLVTVGLAAMGTIHTNTPYWHIGVFMALIGIGLGLAMQNLVLASQNSVAQTDLGSASGTISFFRSLGGATGVAALGALLDHRVRDLTTSGIAAAGIDPTVLASAGSGIPKLALVPEPVRQIVQNAYGDAMADVFLAAAPFALIAFIAVLFIKEVPLRASNSRAVDPEMEITSECAGAAGANVPPLSHESDDDHRDDSKARV